MGRPKLSWLVLLCWALLFLCFRALFEDAEVFVKFLKAPHAFSHLNIATFEFQVLVDGDVNSCTNCSLSCKLDSGSESDCGATKVSYQGLQDGNHTFGVCINGSQGVGCATYNWTVDRRSVFVDLRIHIPEKLLQLNNEIRTVKATNNYDNLKFYLYFSEPVLNSSAEILNSLNISEGVLLPISGENLMNIKFGFQVLHDDETEDAEAPVDSGQKN